MAAPLTPTQLLAVVQGAGLDYYEMPGWRDRCRCHPNSSHERADGPTARPWGPWHGITLHHTAGAMLAGQAAIDYTTRILIGGNGATPGPLSQFGIDSDGRVLLVAAGRSNHIGSVSRASVDAMKAASFSLAGSQNLRGTGVDGNTHTYGMELLAPGTPNAAQRRAAVVLAAALCRAVGWTGQEVHGHGECSDQRDFSDPGLDMGAVRRDVMALTAAPVEPPPPGHPGEVVTPPPATPVYIPPSTTPRKAAAVFVLASPNRFWVVDPTPGTLFDMGRDDEARDNILIDRRVGNDRQVDVTLAVLRRLGFTDKEV